MPSLNQWDISPAAATRTTAAPTAIRPAALRFVWLEITGSCQLHCGHCYADSSPAGTHGQMTTTDWRRVIGEVAALGAGRVQFIGGEPTMHPDFLELVEHALDQGLRVEVYSNLVRITEAMWEMFRRPGVSLATSWYSDTPTEHQQIVGGNKHAYRNTLANIARARADGIEIRAGLISFTDQQRVDAAERQLARLGITRTGIDHVRGVGRGANGNQPNVDALCGQCANGKLAILPDGDAYPCVFSRWPAMRAGNVLDQPLQEIITGHPLTTTRTQLQHHFNQPHHQLTGCIPDTCDPNDGCDPSHCGPIWCSPGPNSSGPQTVVMADPSQCDPDDSCDPVQCMPACLPPSAMATAQSGTTAHNCDPHDSCQPNCAPQTKGQGPQALG